MAGVARGKFYPKEDENLDTYQVIFTFSWFVSFHHPLYNMLPPSWVTPALKPILNEYRDKYHETEGRARHELMSALKAAIREKGKSKVPKRLTKVNSPLLSPSCHCPSQPFLSR
jgi:hypothetical protein